jgi:hypothetical protein
MLHGRTLQNTPSEIQEVTIEVILDPTEDQDATMQAQLSNGSAIDAMLSTLGGVYGAAVQWNASYSSRLSITASIERDNGVTISATAMQTAIASAVSSSLVIDATQVVPAFSSFGVAEVAGSSVVLNPTNPTNPIGNDLSSPAPPPIGELSTHLGTDGVPGWGVALIVIASVIAVLACVGLMLQMRAQPMRLVSLWPMSQLSERTKMVGELRGHGAEMGQMAPAPALEKPRTVSGQV